MALLTPYVKLANQWADTATTYAQPTFQHQTWQTEYLIRIKCKTLVTTLTAEPKQSRTLAGTHEESWVQATHTHTQTIYMVWQSSSRTDIRGIVHYEFVPTGQTVNQVYYLEVSKRLREKVRWKWPKPFVSNSWILHHDNAPAHTALSVREFLATKQITVLEHPAYSPDLAPVPEDRGNIERTAFWWYWWHQE